MLKGELMVRTQIQLTEEQAEKLRELSAASRESVAALIRQAVDQFIVAGKPDRSALYRRAESVVGRYKSDSGDISIHHDRYLEEDFGS
jgi:Spy/CpxP family protein refolding chaperone